MPDLNETTYAQSVPISSPRSRRVDRSRERYPRDGSLEEAYVEERLRRRPTTPPKQHLPLRRDEIARRPYRPSRSVEPRRRQITFDDGGHQSSDDSDSDYKRGRVVSRRRPSDLLKLVPDNDDYREYRHKRQPKSKSRDYESDSEDGYFTDDEAIRLQTKQRNRTILYTGLACVTSVAAANSIYQNTKAHHARRNQLRDSKLDPAEAEKLKKKALMMDVFTLGVAAVGLNNCHNGWKRLESVKKGN